MVQAVQGFTPRFAHAAFVRYINSSTAQVVVVGGMGAQYQQDTLVLSVALPTSAPFPSPSPTCDNTEVNCASFPDCVTCTANPSCAFSYASLGSARGMLNFATTLDFSFLVFVFLLFFLSRF